MSDQIFTAKYILICLPIVRYIYYAAKNNETVSSALKKLRAIIGYFDSSTQAMDKLINFQKTTDVKQYKELKGKGLKPLQDVPTRWWSTHRSLSRMRFLNKAIRALLAAKEITCVDLTDAEWLVLHQIEMLLETMAYFQRTLEGESYVTISLVSVTVYQIRAAYVEAIKCNATDDAVKKLAKTLLEDFDNRYHPEDKNEGTLSYNSDDTLGKSIVTSVCISTSSLHLFWIHKLHPFFLK